MFDSLSQAQKDAHAAKIPLPVAGGSDLKYS
jgi:hypothetical protein